MKLILIVVLVLNIGVLNAQDLEYYDGYRLMKEYCEDTGNADQCLWEMGYYDKSMSVLATSVVRTILRKTIGNKVDQLTDAMIDQIKKNWTDPNNLPGILFEIKNELERHRREVDVEANREAEAMYEARRAAGAAAAEMERREEERRRRRDRGIERPIRDWGGHMDNGRVEGVARAGMGA